MANLSAAVTYANRLAASEEFWADIAAKPAFDFTTLTPAEVADRLRASSSTVTVKLYRARWPATIAATDPDNPHTIFYSKSKTGRPVADMVNTLVHEFVHNVDYFDDGNEAIEMGHGDNSATDKSDSAPYWIGGLAERHYRTVHPVPKAFEAEPFAEEFGVDPASIIEE